MKRAFLKEIVRELRHAPGRFIALIVIVGVGCGFFAGLKMSGEQMRIAADTYFDASHLYDIEILSDRGIGSQEIQEIAQTPGVDAVEARKSLDVIASFGHERYACRITSLPDDELGQDTQPSADNSTINQLTLLSGRWPNAPNECVVLAHRADKLEQTTTIDVIQTTVELDGVLQERTFTVVGTVQAPEYSYSAFVAPTSLGSGIIQQVLYVEPDAFAQDAPNTELYVDVAHAQKATQDKDAYEDVLSQTEQAIEDKLAYLGELRKDELITDAQNELNTFQQELDTRKKDTQKKLDDASNALDSARSTLDNQQQTLSASETEIMQGRAALKQAEDELVQQREALQTAQDQLSALEASAAVMTVVPDELQAQIDALTNQISSASSQIESAQQTIDDKRSQLDQAQTALDSGKEQLERSRATYEQNRASFETQCASTEEQFQDAQDKLDEAQSEIDSVETPTFYLVDRLQNTGFSTYEDNSRRIDAIASIFPLFFFIVAALVVLTTMTRMVEDDREVIGTHKALGYGGLTISSRYLFYAFFCSCIGAVVGIAISSQLLPYVIFNAYNIAYDFPNLTFPLIPQYEIAFQAALLGIAVAVCATLAACISTVREIPARLMQQRAPKPGKRILLERLKPLWQRLSFTNKVTFRNIFRYKKRFFMTLVGIAGCTALLLCGIGIRDAINDIIDTQFGDIFHYDTTIGLVDDATDAELDELQNYCMDTNQGGICEFVYTSNQLVKDSDNKNLSCQVVAYDSFESLTKAVSLRNRLSGESISPTQDSCIVSEKLATINNLDVGDALVLYETDATGNATTLQHTFYITAICENYVSNYIYVPTSLYEQVFDTTVRPNTVWATLANTAQDSSNIAQQLEDMDVVKTVVFNTETINTYRKFLSTMDGVMGVLISSAALLAVVVIYNLTNINISERKREIATLKVLGFTKREINAYIFKEIMILVCIGAFLGLFVGTILEGYVIQTAEIETIMFVRTIHWQAYLISFVATLLFAIVILQTMRPKLRSIDMVESLKSGE